VLALLTTCAFIGLVVLVVLFHPKAPTQDESYPTQELPPVVGGPQQQSQMTMMSPQGGYPVGNYPPSQPGQQVVMVAPQQSQMTVMPTVYGGAAYQPYGAYGTYNQRPMGYGYGY